jgi:hypothetical protein
MKKQNENSENLEKANVENDENSVKEHEELIVVDTKDSAEDTVVETETESTEVEAAKEDIADDVQEDETVVENDEAKVEDQIKNINKNDAAQMLVGKARIIVEESEAQLEQCKLLLASDLQDYEKAKQELEEQGIDVNEQLLVQLGYEGEESIALDEDIVAFEPKQEVAPLYIKDVSSGKFFSFIIALIAGILTLLGMSYIASEKMGITVNLANLGSQAERQPIESFYSRLIGLHGDVFYGAAFMIAVVLLVMFLVYKIRVSRRASKNLDFATEQLEAAEAYTAQKGSCKEEMDKVDAYIHNVIETFKTYEVILAEQKGKLERILFIEHDKIESSDFSPKSTLEMKDTDELINAIKDFMSVPMSEEGTLSGKSSLFLHRAKNRIQKVLDRLY